MLWCQNSIKPSQADSYISISETNSASSIRVLCQDHLLQLQLEDFIDWFGSGLVLTATCSSQNTLCCIECYVTVCYDFMLWSFKVYL